MSVTNFRDGQQNGAVSPPPSEPFRLTGKTQNYKVQLETNVDGGNVKASSITLQKEVTTRSGKTYQGYATSFDGGKTWYEPGSKPPKKISTSTGLTAEEIKSLQPGGELNKKSVGSAQLIAKKNGASKLQESQLKKGNDAAVDPNQTEVEDAKLTEALAQENPQTRNKFPGANGGAPLKYPLDLKNERQDVIRFRMVQYSPKKFDRSQADKDLNVFSGRRAIDDTNTIGTVVLPIPSGISDSNGANWGSDTLDPLKSNLVNIANAYITRGFGVGAETAGQTAGNIGENTADVQAAATNLFVQAATGTTNLLSRTRGAIYNPNMELLFQGPTLRPFTFTFKLSARSASEAKAIRSIIRFFKQGMSPIRTQSQLFLKAPHTFQIDYRHKGQPHDYLNKFKECALQSFAVDYTPEGQYATFTDGAMVSYQITMQFQELEPIFNDDYRNAENAPDTEIGY